MLFMQRYAELAGVLNGQNAILEEVADLLKVSRDTVCRLAQRRRMPAVKIGG